MDQKRKMILSTLWIFAILNYLYADVFTVFFNPAAQADTAASIANADRRFIWYRRSLPWRDTAPVPPGAARRPPGVRAGAGSPR